MAEMFFNKVKSFTTTPAGGSAITLKKLTNGSFVRTQNTNEQLTSDSVYPVLIPGGAANATLTVTTLDVSKYDDFQVGDYHESVTLGFQAYECGENASGVGTILISDAMVTEVSELAADGSGDTTTSYTVTFRATADCAAGDPTITVTLPTIGA